MRQQTRTQIMQVVVELERGKISQSTAAVDLRRILNHDLADTIERQRPADARQFAIESADGTA